MKRSIHLPSLLVLASLAACRSEAALPPEPSRPAVLDFSACKGQTMTLEEFVKTCQAQSGLNFTYTADTQAALASTPMRLSGDAHIPREDFEAFLGAQLASSGFECERVGPEHVHVMLIRRRAG